MLTVSMQRDIKMFNSMAVREQEWEHLINSRLSLYESFVIRWLHFHLFSAKNCRNKYLITDLYAIGAIKFRWSNIEAKKANSWLNWNLFVLIFFPVSLHSQWFNTKSIIQVYIHHYPLAFKLATKMYIYK